MKLSATTAVIAGFVAVAAALPTANVVVRSGGVDNAVIVARDDVVVDAAQDRKARGNAADDLCIEPPGSTSTANS
ncbi:hypothetical protein IF1G_09002 [Cordyceps javanica]|uniref:Uncharacterized protein n=1 Tax=Cordyceps javanica TaxID=43265 RepID=A0A545USN5_9HYPO|nr:hypothetical protein IF1G_09002 [Cordyceps javanica]